MYIQRAPAVRMTAEAALKRYLREVTPTKRESTQIGEYKKVQVLIKHLGKYSLAALSADIVAQYRDTRLAGDKDENGKQVALREHPSSRAISRIPAPRRIKTLIFTTCSSVNIVGGKKTTIIAQVGRYYIGVNT
jgi:hypothetical protein